MTALDVGLWAVTRSPRRRECCAFETFSDVSNPSLTVNSLSPACPPQGPLQSGGHFSTPNHSCSRSRRSAGLNSLLTTLPHSPPAMSHGTKALAVLRFPEAGRDGRADQGARHQLRPHARRAHRRRPQISRHPSSRRRSRFGGEAHGRLPPDGRDAARVTVAERLRRRPALDTPADDTRDRCAALLRCSQPGNRLSVPGEARGDVADRKDDPARVDGETRPHCRSAGLVLLRAEPRGGRRGLHTGGPQHRPCRQNFAREQHAVFVDLLDPGVDADRYQAAGGSSRRRSRAPREMSAVSLGADCTSTTAAAAGSIARNSLSSP